MAAIYPKENDPYSTYSLLQSRFAFHRGFVLVKELQVFYKGEYYQMVEGKAVPYSADRKKGIKHYRAHWRRFDYLAIPRWGQDDSLFIFEEKKTVSDLRREFENNYSKSQCAREWATNFYLILPYEMKEHKVIEEIPKSWGIFWKYEKQLRKHRESYLPCQNNNMPRYVYGQIVGNYLGAIDERERQQQLDAEYAKIDLEYAEKKENV